jgi:hypothetical protein
VLTQIECIYVSFPLALQSGKTRSFRQDYNVHSNGAFTLGGLAVAPAAAAMQSQPQIVSAATAALASKAAASPIPDISSTASKEAPLLLSSGVADGGSASTSSPAVGTVALHSHRPSAGDSQSSARDRDPLPQLNNPRLAASVGQSTGGIKPVIFSAAGTTKPGASLRKLADVEGVGGAGGYDDDAEDDEEGREDLDDDLDL